MENIILWLINWSKSGDHFLLNSMPNELKKFQKLTKGEIYRGLSLDNINEKEPISIENFGRSWTYDLQTAEYFSDNAGNGNYSYIFTINFPINALYLNEIYEMLINIYPKSTDYNEELYNKLKRIFEEYKYEKEVLIIDEYMFFVDYINTQMTDYYKVILQ
jgi:hypothetical protein